MYSRYLSQNFPATVALPRDRIRDYPGHLWRRALIRSLPPRLTGPLRRFTHATAVWLLGSDISLYFHYDAYSGMQPETRSGSLYTLAPTPPHCLPPSVWRQWNQSMRSAWYRLPWMYIWRWWWNTYARVWKSVSNIIHQDSCRVVCINTLRAQ